MAIPRCLHRGSSFTYSNCNQSKKKPTNPFAQEVTTVKTEEHTRVPGTKIYAVVPEEYKYEQKGRYVISTDEFIAFTTLPIPFEQAKENLSESDFEQAPLFFNETKLNNRPAFYAEGQDSTKNENLSILLVKVEEATLYALAHTHLDKPAHHEAVRKIMSSVIYEEEENFDPLEEAMFIFNQKITGFKHAQTNTNSYRFTADGTFDITNKNSILISHLSGMSLESAQKYVQRRIDANNKTRVTSSEINISKVGNNNLITFESIFNYDDDRNIMTYNAMLNNERQSLMFVGTAVDQFDDLKEQYEKTVKSIRFKNQ